MRHSHYSISGASWLLRMAPMGAFKFWGEFRWIRPFCMQQCLPEQLLGVAALQSSRSTNSANPPLVVHLLRDATMKKQQEQFTHQVLGAAERLREGGVSPAVRAVPAESHTGGLTERERDVLSRLAQGLSTRAIAQALSISPSTTRNHIQNILHKLHVHSRLEAVTYAFAHGLVVRE